MNGLRIAEVAKRSGRRVETIRHYAHAGCCQRPSQRFRMPLVWGYSHRPAGVHSAPQGARSVVATGSARATKRGPGQVKALVAEQRVLIDAKLEALQRQRRVLCGLAHSGNGQGPLAACPIIHCHQEGEGRT